MLKNKETVRHKKSDRFTYGYSPEEYKRFRHFGWRYLISFCILYCTLYCTRLSLANAGAVMIEQSGFTKADIGVLTSILFFSYGFGQFINGRLSDLTSPAKMIVIAVVLSSGCNFLMCTQTKLLPMGIIWAVNGFVQSMAWAPGITIITRWWPGHHRGFATGFALAFSGFGQVVATLTAVFALESFYTLGWKGVFLVSAIIPLVLLVLYFIFAPTSPEKVKLKPYQEDEDSAKIEESISEESSGKGVTYAYRYCIAQRRFRVWMAIIFFAGIARYGLSTWVPMYFIEQYDIDITSGLIQSLTLPIGMGLGTIIVPTITDKVCHNNRIHAVMFAAFFAAVFIGLFTVLDPTVGLEMIIIELCLFGAGFCIFAISGTSGAFATDVGGRIFSGTATGILSFSAYIGAAVQSLVYGFLLDTAGWYFVFISIIAFCILMMGLAIHQIRNKKKEKSSQI